MSLKIGGLFAGYGGLDMAISSVLDAEPVWFSEFDKGPSKILAHHFPDIPNHGDITKIDWSQVGSIDILAGGSPCQDLSTAGKRQGMTEGTRSNLWVAMREAIAQLNPRLVVWENVGGAFSAAANSEVEPCAGCVGDGSGTHLRAFGRVLGDLAALGYDARWISLRAADVGAPHGRLRVFLIAEPANQRHEWARSSRDGGAGPTDGSGRDVRVLPTPTTRDWKDHTIRREPHRPDDVDTLARALTDVPAALLPTPAVNDMGAAYTPETWDEWTDAMKAKHGNGNRHGKSLNIEAQRLLPTPVVTDSTGTRNATAGRSPNAKPFSVGTTLGDVTYANQWGQYADAVQRWEHLTRPAPAPTEPGPKGNPRLSARFSEWMMGLPAGWVTDVPGITRNEALKALGNGVVPQQGAAALRWLLGTSTDAV